MSDKKQFYISASSIKEFKQCSLRYYYARHLKVPQANNSGALAGTCAHTILEALLKKKHRKNFDNVLINKTIDKCPSIKRYVESYIKKTGLGEEFYKKIGQFIAVGVGYDFFCEGGNIEGAEIPFEIGSEEDGYFVRGFIDRLAIYNNKWASIRDYKSSKQKFSGKDLDENIQALIYALAVKKLYPDLKLSSVVDFLFLAFPDEPKQRFPVNGKPITEAMLLGLEEYLRDVYKEMSSFTAADRWKNVAYNNPPPSDGSFGGKLMCGFAKVKGQLKKDGNPYYCCPYRFDTKYYVLLDKDGKILKSAFTNAELTKKDGETIEEREFAGCERMLKKSER